MSPRVVRDLDRATWSDFVHRTSTGNVFHTPEMADVFARAAGHRPELWAVLDGDEILGLLPTVRLTLLRGLMAPLTTRSVAYGGLLVADRPGAAGAVSELLQTYGAEAGRRSLFTELRNVHDEGQLRGTIEQAGYRYEPHLNYLIRLDRPPDEVYRSMGRRTRQHIRRALGRQDVRITEVGRVDEVAAWYRTLQRTYRHAGVPLADESLFRAAWEVLAPRAMIRLYTAWVGDAPAACSAELTYRDRIYAWYGGTDRAFSAKVPNELLMWHILDWGARNGYAVYDFGGAGRPDEPYGVRDFKAKFGGDLVEFGRFVAVHAPRRLAVSERGYRVYRRILRRRPERPRVRAPEMVVDHASGEG